MGPKEVNQTKYRKIKVVNFVTDQWDHGYKITIQKCIQRTQKENLLLLKDLLELEKTKSTNTWMQYQKMCTMIN